MDPIYQSCPQVCSSFTTTTTPPTTLYYELRGSPESLNKVVLIMGAFGTLRHFDQLADHLANMSCEVLTLGIGKSVPSPFISQTSDLLALDTVQLLHHVWGQTTKFHVFGASMGGMVAQKVAIQLLHQQPEPQLASLYLAVTARCYGFARYIPLSAGFYKLVLPYAIPMSNPTAMINQLLPKAFSKEYLDSIHPTEQKTIRELWLKRWVDEYPQWWSLGDLEATASQSTVAGTHYLNDAQVNDIANQDELMSPVDQKKLAAILHAATRISSGGHMGTTSEFQSFCADITEFITAT